MGIQVCDKKTKQTASRSLHTAAAVSRAEKKETLTQKKLRQARELIDAAKQEEQKAWRAKWEAQKTDPVYQARQARLAENREERSSKTAIGRENRRLARTEQMIKLADLSEQNNVHTAWHESGHAVIHEVLSDGVIEATIVPTANEEVTKTKTGALRIHSLGHVVHKCSSLPVSERRRYLHAIAGLLAGGIATEKALGYAWGTGGDEEQIANITIQKMHLSQDEALAFIDEATALCEAIMAEPKVWKAIDEVKEALLTEKTISGHLVRAIVKKQDRPDLFPIEISKQRSFHFRQNYIATGSQNGSALYVLKVGNNPWFAGWGLANPPYVDKVTKDNAQPVPNFRPEPVQLLLHPSPETQANSGEAVANPPRLFNHLNNAVFAFRENMVKADKLLLAGAVGREIEIPGEHYVPKMSVVIKSREGNKMIFEWEGISFTITQNGFEFDFCAKRDNSIGMLLAAAIDEYAQHLEDEDLESEQDEWLLEEAA